MTVTTSEESLLNTDSGRHELDIIVTAHAEGPLLATTLRSVAAATSNVDGRCGLIIMLDNANELTRACAEEFAHSPAWDSVRLLEVNFGEPGASRRFGIEAAEAQFVAVLDGDDLVTSNYFSAAIEQLHNAAGDLIHPEYVVSFGARDTVSRIMPSHSGQMSFRNLIEHNLWPSSFVAEREVVLRTQKISLSPAGGFGPEDWMWNIQAVADGFTHGVARGTAYFYRVKASAGVNVQHLKSVLPKLPMSDLRQAMPLEPLRGHKTPVDRPATGSIGAVRDLTRKSYRLTRRALRGPGALFHPALMARAQHRLGLWYQKLFRIQLPPTRAVREFAKFRPVFTEAAEIEPALSRFLENIAFATRWSFEPSVFATVFDAAAVSLDGIRAIVAVPWIGIGGADMVALNYVRALNENPRYRGRVAVVTFHTPARTDMHLIPDGIRVVQFPAEWRNLDPDRRNRLVANVLIQTEPELVVAVNGFDVVEALETFGHQITQRTRVFATLFSWDKTRSGYPTSPMTDLAERRYLKYLSGILTDNPVSARLIAERLNISPNRVQVHLQPALAEIPALVEAGDAPRFDSAAPFRVVWPHRLDPEKRPEVVCQIARVLRERNLPVQIDVWGSTVLGGSSSSLLGDLRSAGVRYRGPYSGGLTGIPNVSEYHALLLTSQNEGLPLVLVQAQHLGIPVIASGVGGVPHLVEHGVTGFVTSGPDDIDGFVDAIVQLMTNRDANARIRRAAFHRARERHSWESFEERVDRDLVGSPLSDPVAELAAEPN